MRLFFAVTPPDHVRAKIAHWQQLWSKSVHNVKWVKEENLHLTLKFLGEVVPTQLDQVVSAARSALVGHPAFALVVGGTGVFPHPRRARVLWLGLKDDAGQLARLQQYLDRSLSNLGFPSENKPFAPHLTLGRLRQPSEVARPVFPAENLILPVNRIILYESILKPHGPLYKPLATFKLQ